MFNKLIILVNRFSSLKYFIKSPLNFFYSVYFTLRYIDKWNSFPAVYINGKVKIKVYKHKSAYFQINNRLIFEQWLLGQETVSIYLSEGSKFLVENDFSIGNGVKIFLDKNAIFRVKGIKNETGSGFTSNSVVLVKKEVSIGYDCIIAWDTYITDCDWHPIDGKNHTSVTKIGNHIWIGVGTKILKGVNVKDNSIITSQSILLSGEYSQQSLISGMPAKIIKENIPNWKREMKAK